MTSNEYLYLAGALRGLAADEKDRAARHDLEKAADALVTLRQQNTNLLRAVNSKQAKIDALMMEFCPGEMSAEQRKEWAEHQRPVSETEARRDDPIELLTVARACLPDPDFVPTEEEEVRLRSIRERIDRYLASPVNGTDSTAGASKEGRAETRVPRATETASAGVVSAPPSAAGSPGTRKSPP